MNELRGATNRVIARIGRVMPISPPRSGQLPYSVEWQRVQKSLLKTMIIRKENDIAHNEIRQAKAWMNYLKANSVGGSSGDSTHVCGVPLRRACNDCPCQALSTQPMLASRAFLAEQQEELRIALLRASCGRTGHIRKVSETGIKRFLHDATARVQIFMRIIANVFRIPS